MSILSVQGCFLKPQTQKKIEHDALLFAEKELPHHGRLVQNADGYAYVKVDDRYIHELYKKLNVAKDGFEKPPYFRRKNSPGAHISVVYKNEHVHLEEVGQTFDFTLGAIKEVGPNQHTRYLVIEVSAPQLVALRKKYNLPAKLNNYEFHITIGKKVTLVIPGSTRDLR